jgi:hypothetical protein
MADGLTRTPAVVTEHLVLSATLAHVQGASPSLLFVLRAFLHLWWRRHF